MYFATRKGEFDSFRLFARIVDNGSDGEVIEDITDEICGAFFY